MTMDVKKDIQRLLNKKGQGMAEYVLIIGFIALTVLVSLTPVAEILINKFTEFAAVINGR